METIQRLGHAGGALVETLVDGIRRFKEAIPAAPVDRIRNGVPGPLSKVFGGGSSEKHAASLQAAEMASAATLSDFQRRKLTHLFKTFYDTTNDGIITRVDFTKMLNDIQKFRGWDARDPQYGHAQDAITKVFVNLRRVADDNRDDKITLEEWLTYWSKFAAQARVEGGWPEDGTWQKEYACFLFEFYDTSGDGSVDESEYVNALGLYGLNPSECRESFRKLTTTKAGGRMELTKQNYLDLYLEYLTSDNLADPGNYLAGKIWSG